MRSGPVFIKACDITGKSFFYCKDGFDLLRSRITVTGYTVAIVNSHYDRL